MRVDLHELAAKHLDMADASNCSPHRAAEHVATACAINVAHALLLRERGLDPIATAANDMALAMSLETLGQAIS